MVHKSTEYIVLSSPLLLFNKTHWIKTNDKRVLFSTTKNIKIITSRIFFHMKKSNRCAKKSHVCEEINFLSFILNNLFYSTAKMSFHNRITFQIINP